MLRAEWDELLLIARQGNLDALAHLLELACEDLREAASGVLGRATLMRLPVDDVFSDALMSVLREIGSLRATNYVGFRYWFASIARNQVRRALRRQRERAGMRVEGEPPRGEETVVREPRALSPAGRAFLQRSLPRLASSQRVAFVLREGLALSWTTIAFVLDRRETPSARLLHYRAVLRLKELATTKREARLVAALGA